MISPIGLAVAGVGALALMLPVGWSLFLLIFLSPFRTAMALSPPGMGGASILVPHFFLGFFVLRVLKKLGPGPIVSALSPRSAGFALALVIAYGLVGSVFYPRVFAGVTETVSLQRGLDGETVLVLTPLAFGGTYLTQGIYALGGLMAFAASFALFRTHRMWERLLVAMLALCTLNIVLALLDLLTHMTGTTALLGFMRNASYGMLVEAEKGGLKRIAGSFSEASAFAVFTLAMFAFVASLWLDRVVAPRLSAVLTVCSLGLLLAATSGTGYVGLIGVVAFLGMRHVGLRKTGRAGRRLGALLGLGLLSIAGVLAFVVLAPGATEAIGLFIQETVVDKAESQSGQERGMWNAVAFQNALDTWGLGVGIGGARASSYALVLLSNVGVPGLLLYLFFITKVLFAQPSMALDAREASVLRACRAAIMGFLAGHILVGTIFDQSPLFYAICGALAAATLAPVPVLSRVRAHPAYRAVAA